MRDYQVLFSHFREFVYLHRKGCDLLLELNNLFLLLNPRGTSLNLSKATGISTGNISDWKSGKSKPTAEALVLIANFFDVSVDYLLGRTNNPEVNK